MEELLASLSSSPISLERGQEVEGKIISINGSEVTVDLGLKSEGVIPGREISNEALKVGDMIKATVSVIENENGQVILSTQKVGKQKAQISNTDSKKWDALTEKLTREEIIKGKVTKITQFGVFVQIQDPSTGSTSSLQASSGHGGIEGLIHISHLSPDDKFEAGQVISVSVDSIDKEKSRIALSPVRISTKGLIYK